MERIYNFLRGLVRGVTGVALPSTATLGEIRRGHFGHALQTYFDPAIRALDGPTAGKPSGITNPNATATRNANLSGGKFTATVGGKQDIPSVKKPYKKGN